MQGLANHSRAGAWCTASSHAVEVAECRPDRGVLVAGCDRVENGTMVVSGQRRGVDALGEVVGGAGGFKDPGEQVGQHRISRMSVDVRVSMADVRRVLHRQLRRSRRAVLCYVLAVLSVRTKGRDHAVELIRPFVIDWWRGPSAIFLGLLVLPVLWHEDVKCRCPSHFVTANSASTRS